MCVTGGRRYVLHRHDEAALMSLVWQGKFDFIAAVIAIAASVVDIIVAVDCNNQMMNHRNAFFDGIVCSGGRLSPWAVFVTLFFGSFYRCFAILVRRRPSEAAGAITLCRRCDGCSER
jgi:hypothetical protein